MNTLERFTINNHFYANMGPWGVAWRDRLFGHIQELCAPVFHQRFTADVFCEVLPKLTATIEDPDAERKLAKQIENFVQEWDDAHAEDDKFPTKDGRYPSPTQMAKWFLEWYAAEKKEAA